MLKIDGKVFLNIQEAVGWLMANNALPFQCTANYVADTEIPLSDIVNPSPAKVRIGSIVFFADSKAATVTGVTANSFTVGADHIDMGDIHNVTGDVSITGDLSASNINVSNNANVGKLNSEKLNQKYEGAIKAELHVDEQGIAEAINPGNTGRFETTRVIKPSEVKTEIYDTQANKRMSFRLPYFEASAGNHRLLTEEDLGGGGTPLLEDIEDADGHKRFAVYNGTPLLSSAYITNMFAKASLNGYVLNIVCFYHKQDNITLAQGTYLCEFELPQWINDLIITNPESTVVLRTNDYVQWASGDDPAISSGQVTVSKTDGKLKLRLGIIDNQPDRKNVRVEFSINLGA